MSDFQLVHGSCAEQKADAVVNAANGYLWEGGGICGVIFQIAGSAELTRACQKYKTPLKDGSAVITPAFQMRNAKAIIHAVGPDFRKTPKALKELYDAYHNSLLVLKDNNYHSISFPLISSGIFAGNLADPAEKSSEQCCRAYQSFVKEYPEYEINVFLCAYTEREYVAAERVFGEYFPGDN